MNFVAERDRDRKREREKEREREERERDIHSRHIIIHSSELQFDLKRKWNGNEVVQY